MKGRTPKPPELRQRRNRAPSAALLPTEAESSANEVPALPVRGAGAWHPQVIEWWESVWRSPMAAEYLDADMRGGLYLLAELHQQRWLAETTQQVVQCAAEIRLQEVRFGLSPIDRRRLQWEVEKGEAASERTETRRSKRGRADPAKDPRSVLRVAK